MSISEWQAQYNALMRVRCSPCHGSGALDNAKLGGKFFVAWTCQTCGGNGYTPQPISHMPPNDVIIPDSQ